MGKATRWLKRLLGMKKDSSSPRIQSREQTSKSCFPEPKSKWRNVKSCRRNDEGSADLTSETNRSANAVVGDRSKEMVVVPAEKSAVVQTAVNPTGGDRCGYVSRGYAGYRIRKQWAAVTIQSHFRGYLARRARRALKGLVKLQALVRGNMVRKQTAHMMIRLEALLKAQARARLRRSQSHLLHSFSKSTQFDSNTQGPSTPENIELAISKRKNFSMLKRSGGSKLDMDQLTIELDSPKPSLNRKSPMKPFDRSNSSDQYSRIFTATSIDSTLCHSAQSASSYEVQSLTPVKFVLYPQSEDNQLKEPVTPTRSMNSLRSTSSHNPSYMSGTQSSRAKTRSSSAPKLRPGLERSTSTTKRVLSLHGYAAADQSKQFEKKAYPGSGQLDLLGMPYSVSEF